MKCDKARVLLDACFDTGDAPEAALSTHVGVCSGCRAYSEELNAFDLAFDALPAVAAPPATETRMTLAMRQENLRLRRWKLGVPVAGLVAVVVLSLFLPVPLEGAVDRLPLQSTFQTPTWPQAFGVTPPRLSDFQGWGAALWASLGSLYAQGETWLKGAAGSYVLFSNPVLLPAIALLLLAKGLLLVRFREGGGCENPEKKELR